MKQKDIQIKRTAFLLAEGFQLVAETSQYWFRRAHRTAKVLLTDAFTLNVKGGITDFQWEEGELEAGVGVKPLVIEKSFSHEGTWQKHVKRYLIRNLKKGLRFLFLDVPDWFSKKRQLQETIDPYENRIRK